MKRFQIFMGVSKFFHMNLKSYEMNISIPRILLPILAYRIVYTIVPGVPSITNSTGNYSYFLNQDSSLEGAYSTPQPHDLFNATRGDIATFGFLLGTFPTAPTVFVFASQYQLAMETVSWTVVLCTLQLHICAVTKLSHHN